MAVVDGSARWVSWEEAAELAGVRVPTIEHAVRVNRINRRTRNGSQPTLDRDSVLAWASWYREVKQGQAQRRTERERLREASPRRRRERGAGGASRAQQLAALAQTAGTAGIAGGGGATAAEWMSVPAAALALGCSASSVVRWAESGLLTVGVAGGDVKLSRESVDRLVVERAADAHGWVSQAEAAGIVGCSHARVPELVVEGLLVQRPGPRGQASISRESADEAAQVWADRQAAAHAAREARAAKRPSNAAPNDGQVWVTTETAALALGMSRNGVGERIRAGTLPAVLRGNRYWLRRTDVETASAARVFRRSQNDFAGHSEAL
jgi:hypothetical protein